MKFNELGVLPILEEALVKEKILEPTDVQSVAIPLIMQGKNVYISSETGTGKTLAYLLPLISKIDLESKELQVMVIVPTHELALQVQKQVKTLAENSGLNIRSQQLIGGASIERQKESLKAKPHLVVGSPGRIIDLIKMRKLKVHEVSTIVIDEADKLLVSDGLPDTRDIVRATLGGRQMIFVSATVMPESASEAELMAPDLVNVHANANKINQDIKHYYFVSREDEKPELLRKLINAFKPERAIVFVHRNSTAGEIARILAERKIAVAAIHGNCDRTIRKKALHDFRNGKVRVLISSDISARGLDVKDVTHIFNLDIPTKSEDYLHRAGRTARAGATGCSVLLMTHPETSFIHRYKRDLKIEIAQARTEYGEIIVEERTV